MAANNFFPLISEIKSERDRLSNLIEELQDLEDEMDGEPTGVELRATGSILHDYYTGLEKIFRLVALELDGNLPSGKDWHKRLLDRMAAEIEDLRPPVINGGLKEQLGEYLRFRHLFRHMYGFELKWTRCKPLVQKLPPIHRKITAAFDEFENFLREVDRA